MHRYDWKKRRRRRRRKKKKERRREKREKGICCFKDQPQAVGGGEPANHRHRPGPRGLSSLPVFLLLLFSSLSSSSSSFYFLLILLFFLFSLLPLSSQKTKKNNNKKTFQDQLQMPVLGASELARLKPSAAKMSPSANDEARGHLRKSMADEIRGSGQNHGNNNDSRSRHTHTTWSNT